MTLSRIIDLAAEFNTISETGSLSSNFNAIRFGSPTFITERIEAMRLEI
ncbi:hypothetical+protein [Methylocapsa aurea]|jgi:hypothetical protein